MKKEEQKPSKLFAFPGVDENTGAYVDGMTLRDYFAAKAMQSIISSSNYDNFAGNNGMLVPEFVAKEAYQIADAMLKQRGL